MSIPLKVIILNKYRMLGSQPNSWRIVPISYNLDSVPSPRPKIVYEFIPIDDASSGKVDFRISYINPGMTELPECGIVDGKVFASIS